MTPASECDDAPFFIVGAPRSGTTLLRLMMNMHSRLCIPPESHFIPELVTQLKPGWTRDEFAAAICAHPRFAEWGLDHDTVRARLQQVETKWRDVFLALYQEYARRAGKPRWGDKTPGYVQHLKLLDSIFPDARIIHIIRDGRDVACSLRSVPWYEGSVGDCAKYWRRLVEKGRRDGQALGNKRYLEIRYEDLANDAEGTLETVCLAIGEQFERQMLRYFTQPEDQIPEHRMAWHGGTTQPVNKAAVERWRRDLPPADVAEFEVYAGALLRRLGYETQTRWSVRAACKRSAWYLGRVKPALARLVHRTKRQGPGTSDAGPRS